ncbi:ABC transporter permease [Corynebacterium felinum]|uniref:ABC-2 type transport system permease protein n=1 Tax=Corynebacterium felinum TaxID=131318 RepID=A0ABU2BCA3_9CORY|nr:ABC transporter permease [Corynebacterium felinum]MDF5819488.1 ABC transporter permease [Corynebacterium felinum]MDR7355619.1 ABC-2 type transport system permease protein [Corynebacterium felinum]WJY94971.1 hypothetical protein CFELI_06775 [Corynebacterium felinum]
MTAFMRLTIIRPLREPANVFFSIILPAIMYLIIGSAQSFAHVQLPHGDLKGHLLVSMALYGGVTAAVSTAGSAVVDYNSGWGRMLKVTPLPQRTNILTQVITVLAFTPLPIATVLFVGYLNGAHIEGFGWLWAFLISWAVTVPFGFYGLIWAQLIPSPTGISIAATTVVLLAFAANMFFPLSHSLLEIARFTPLFGAAMLARYPVGELIQIIDNGAFDTSTPLWAAFLNIGVWTILFILITAGLAHRERSR